jgi:hypothetical protein
VSEFLFPISGADEYASEDICATDRGAVMRVAPKASDALTMNPTVQQGTPTLPRRLTQVSI